MKSKLSLLRCGKDSNRSAQSFLSGLLFLRSVLWGAMLAGVCAASVTNGRAQVCTKAPSGMISWWRAENNSLDAVGTSHGINVGSVAFGSGRVGQTFNFNDSDGIGSGVQLGNPPALQLQNFTIEGWIRRFDTNIVTRNTERNNSAFLHYGSQGYGFGPHHDGTLLLTKVDVSEVSSSVLRVTDTNFHHVAVTKSGSNVTFYIDGVGENAGPYDPGFVFNSPVAIGAAAGDGLVVGFLGAIDELAVYN